MSPDPALYSFINQGVLTVDSIDDVDEMKITDVSKRGTSMGKVAVPSHWRNDFFFTHFFSRIAVFQNILQSFVFIMSTYITVLVMKI